MYKIQTKLQNHNILLDVIINKPSLFPKIRYFEKREHAEGYIEKVLKNAPGEHIIVEVKDD